MSYLGSRAENQTPSGPETSVRDSGEAAETTCAIRDAEGDRLIVGFGEQQPGQAGAGDTEEVTYQCSDTSDRADNPNDWGRRSGDSEQLVAAFDPWIFAVIPDYPGPESFNIPLQPDIEWDCCEFCCGVGFGTMLISGADDGREMSSTFWALYVLDDAEELLDD